MSESMRTNTTADPPGTSRPVNNSCPRRAPESSMFWPMSIAIGSTPQYSESRRATSARSQAAMIGACGRRAARQHDRVHAVVHGVRGIADLGARGPRLDRHRFENLRRQNDGNALPPRAPCDVFLRRRDALERHLETEVAARDHHALARRQDLVEMIERLRTFELRDERRVAGMSFGQKASRLTQIVGRLNEAEGHHVDAQGHARVQIIDILPRDGRRRQCYAWRIDAFVLAKLSALDDGRLYPLSVGRLDAQFDEAIREQQRIARLDVARETFKRGREPARLALDIAGDDRDVLAFVQDHGTAVLVRAGPDLWTAEVLKNGDVAAGARGSGTNTAVRCG